MSKLPINLDDLDDLDDLLLACRHPTRPATGQVTGQVTEQVTEQGTLGLPGAYANEVELKRLAKRIRKEAT